MANSTCWYLAFAALVLPRAIAELTPAVVDAALHVVEQRVSVASAVYRLVCRFFLKKIWRPVARGAVGGAFLLLISSTSELSQTESVTARSLVGLSNG